MNTRKIILDARSSAPNRWPGSALLNNKKEQCCIGIALSACDIPHSLLLNQGMPRSIIPDNPTHSFTFFERKYIEAWQQPLSLFQWNYLREKTELYFPVSMLNEEQLSFDQFLSRFSTWAAIAAAINDRIARDANDPATAAGILRVVLPFFARHVLSEEWEVIYIPAEKETLS